MPSFSTLSGSLLKPSRKIPPIPQATIATIKMTLAIQPIAIALAWAIGHHR
jgi:hypothetical protein